MYLRIQTICKTLVQRLRENKASSSSMAILARVRINAQDFKSTKLTVAGDTDNYLRSNVAVLTASEFPALNTLGQSASLSRPLTWKGTDPYFQIY
ncbi:hypothetical protein F2Q68_00036531 [Brassica cretica]|uniref:Uncharacterized protein n=1 Tax=Brassica cretica TaxID=69181 RepID=A0A8S9H9P3_BRACR|nr:hypothetical protein F2Q68_00036531 [Brassica cretica]